MTEELAILKRWYYRSHKTGEIIFAKSDGELPIRKLINAVNRIAHPKAQSTKDINAGEEMQ
jgi:hypothetical protein